MLTRRLIVCLDVKGGRVVKGVRFETLRDVGEPSLLAAKYEEAGADEVVLLNVAGEMELEAVRRTAERLFIPLCAGGGVRSVDDVAQVLRSGADKVSINTAAVERPELLSEAAGQFGSQCVVASIDAKYDSRGCGDRWRVYTHGGRTPTALDAVAWVQECVERGAGEVLLTSIDRDGTRDGYDLALYQTMSDLVNVPVIASGGAGSSRHVVEALQIGADAALVAGMVHDGVGRVASIKAAMQNAGIPTRVCVQHVS